jgi:three-Cys-motif partner protein
LACIYQSRHRAKLTRCGLNWTGFQGGFELSKKNDDFFKEKKPWSEVKDELLGCYLRPYIQKIISTRRPTVYVDCFAGKGLFEDGKPGSPLIALKTINDCLGQTKTNQCAIRPIFIDLNYANDLRENLKGYNNIQVVSGKYEESIEGLLSDKTGCNVFLYVDPYGIKALDYRLFSVFSDSKKFNSIELLINMNSFGFIREGCRVLGGLFEDESIFDDLVEYDSTRLDTSEKSIIILNQIAGGDYWKSIIKSYEQKEITIYEAEEQFAVQYCERLRQSYTYVLNMPLRIRRGQLPKYRMIHATNYVEGCLLMVDNICGRWEIMKDIQNSGQMQIWEENYNNQVVDDEDLRAKVVSHLAYYPNFVRLNLVLADFFMKYGPICSTSSVKNIYKELEQNRRIDIKRNPAFTEKTGKPSKFFADEKGKKTELRWLL